MKRLLVSYADERFLRSQKRLDRSALRFGIDEVRAWDRLALERTTFYRQHRKILDKRRGSGYWLWKPFIIAEALARLGDGDILVYSDAGVEIIADLSPLFELCLGNNGMLLFANHPRGDPVLPSNRCSRWTKRDCFVYMDCDTPYYHGSQMLDASFLVLTVNAARGLSREWLQYAVQSRILTDGPNACGLPNLPDFVDHRHDQSILSLLAQRYGIEVFRRPSQAGNHLKAQPYRQPGERLRFPYGAQGIFLNSPYGTLLHHHRRKASPPEAWLLRLARPFRRRRMAMIM